MMGRRSNYTAGLTSYTSAPAPRGETTKKGTHKAVTYSVISAQEGADGAQKAANFQFSRTDLANVGGRRAALDDIVKVYTSGYNNPDVKGRRAPTARSRRHSSSSPGPT